MILIRLTAILITLLMLVGSPVLAKTHCATMMDKSTTQMAHCSCGGERSCCQHLGSENAKAMAACTCAPISQPAILTSLSLKVADESFLKVIASVASVLSSFLFISTTHQDTFIVSQWRPPKIGLYLFYRILRI